MSFPPGSTIGILGGGQLGRMMAIAAARIGYRAHIYDPAEAPCAAEVAGEHTRAAFEDEDALRAFADSCDVVTYEWENIPVGPLAVIADKLAPSTRSLEVAQDRAVEKEFVESAGASVAPWVRVDSAEDARAAAEQLGLPIVLKTRRMGYDGKGQTWIREGDDPADAFASIGSKPAVAEKAIDFDAEFSIVIARGSDGAMRAFDPPLNTHEGGILRRSEVPAPESVTRHADHARDIAEAIITKLDHVGVLTVEYFATADGPLVNEIAPRVHNSGHWTIEGAHTSQFEQHIRAVLGLPLGDPGLVAGGAVMDNLIGDDVERWNDILADAGSALHLYNKGEVRPGRKLGHVTRVK